MKTKPLLLTLCFVLVLCGCSSISPCDVNSTLHNKRRLNPCSPKTESMRPKGFSVPLIQVQVVTNKVAWFNPASLIPVVSNQVVTAVIGTTQMDSFFLPKTRSASIIGPSNGLAATVFSIGTNGLTSPPSNTITNSFVALPPAPPMTNIWQVQPLFSTNLTDWQPSGAPWFVTNVGLGGQGFFRLGVTKQ